MGSLSIWHWLIVVAIILLLFGGRGKVSNLMGDFAKGVKEFKKGLKDETTDGPQPDLPPKVLASETAKPAATAASKDEATSH